nr:unnamed protein product [Haemonchus contortus]
MEQQHHASAGAVHAPKTLDATLPQLQHSSDLLSRPAAPSPAAGGSVPHSEVKRCRNFMRSETVPHSIMVNYPFISPNRSVSESQGFYQLHAVRKCLPFCGSRS